MSKQQRNKKKRSHSRSGKIIHVNIRSSSRLDNDRKSYSQSEKSSIKSNSFHHVQSLSIATVKEIV